MKSLLVVVLLLASGFARAEEKDALTREREEQTGAAITILFDNSGSMRGQKMEQAKAAFRAWLQATPEDYKFSLITFDGDGRLAIPLGEHTREAVAERVAQLSADTGTPICGALRVAREQIEKRRRDVTPYERNVVLVFTDGQETSDRRGEAGVQEDIRALRQEMVEVVGVGFHGQGDYMDGVATRFALANNEQELKQGLAKVDAEIGSVDDLVVSPADLAALKKFRAPEIQPLSAAAIPPAAPSSPAAVPVSPEPPQRGRNNHFYWIIGAIIVWFAIRAVVSQKDKSRR